LRPVAGRQDVGRALDAATLAKARTAARERAWSAVAGRQSVREPPSGQRRLWASGKTSRARVRVADDYLVTFQCHARPPPAVGQPAGRFHVAKFSRSRAGRLDTRGPRSPCPDHGRDRTRARANFSPACGRAAAGAGSTMGEGRAGQGWERVPSELAAAPSAFGGSSPGRATVSIFSVQLERGGGSCQRRSLASASQSLAAASQPAPASTLLLVAATGRTGWPAGRHKLVSLSASALFPQR
jgi:hypothetical protein